MLISFPNIEATLKPNVRGGEKAAAMKTFQSGETKIMTTRLEPGASIGIHTHEDSCEIYYYISGSGRCYYDGAWEPVRPGCAHYCPKGHTHGLENNGDEDLVFFAVICAQ